MAETPQQYKHRILRNLEGLKADRVRATSADRIAALIRSTSAKQLATRPAPAKWSVAEIVAHLADVEVAVSYRIRAILGSPGIAIQAFDQDAWAANMGYAKRNPRQSLAAFHALRTSNEELLHSLDPEQWEHYGMHAERGQESIRTIAEMLAGHDINHIRQIEAILKAPKNKR